MISTVRYASTCAGSFGEFEFDSQAGKLFRGGRPVKIQPQPLRVLGVLVERPGQIVTREQLRARIWGGATFVEFDQGLNYCMRQIRLALGDDANAPVFIETLPKQGYRLIAPVATAVPVLFMDAKNDRTTDSVTELAKILTRNKTPNQVILYDPFRPAQNSEKVAPGHLIFSVQGYTIWQDDVRNFFDQYIRVSPDIGWRFGSF